MAAHSAAMVPLQDSSKYEKDFRESGMRPLFRVVLLTLLCGVSLAAASAQGPTCPMRPLPGTPVLNPLDLFSQNGVLNLSMTLQNQMGSDGFMHYCYVYMYQGQQVEAPTLRVNPGDQLVLNLTDNIQAPYAHVGPNMKKQPMDHMSMGMGAPHQDGPDDPCNGTTVLPGSTNI